MSQFVFLFRTGDDAQREALGTPERAQRSMQAWLEWIRDLEARGHLVDAGQPLARAGKVVRGDAKLVTDGPYVEVKDFVAGFLVVEARDIEEAIALSKGCPMVRNGSVEIRPVAQLAH